MTTPTLDHLMHHANLRQELQAAVERAFKALTLAEQAYQDTPTLDTAQALAQAEDTYQLALANRDQLKK